MRLLITAVITLIAAIVVFLFWRRGSRTESRASGLTDLTTPAKTVDAIDLSLYAHNSVTFTTFWAVVLTLIVGFILAITNHLIGVAIVTLVVYAWVKCEVDHPVDPPTLGVLKRRSKNMKLTNGELSIVSGRVILFPFWPFELSTTAIDVSAKTKKSDVIVYAKHGKDPDKKIAIPAKLAINFTPNPDDLLDFIQSAGSEGVSSVFDLVDDLILQDLRAITSGYEPNYLVANPKLIANALTEVLNNEPDISRYGVKIKSAQFEPNMPKEVLEKMTGTLVESYERDAELADYETYVIAAKKLQAEYIADNERDTSVKIPTFAQCMEEIRRSRLTRDGLLQRIETTPGAHTVILGDTDHKHRKG